MRAAGAAGRPRAVPAVGRDRGREAARGAPCGAGREELRGLREGRARSEWEDASQVRREFAILRAEGGQCRVFVLLFFFLS